MNKHLLLLLLFQFTVLTNKSFAQKQKKSKWGVSIALNSIQAQVEIPLMTSIGSISQGAGSLLVDADGNIIAKGKRNDNSYSLSLVPKYDIDDDFLVRVEFGFTNLSLKANIDSKSADTHDIANTKITTQILRFSPGFQWVFMKKKKLESFCGMTISYINYQNININIYSESRGLRIDTIQSWLKKNENTPGGFALGIGAFAGFNIYLDKDVSLGAELYSAAMYYKLGGVSNVENSEQVSINPVNTYITTSSNSFNGFKISKIMSSFNITVWF